MFRHLCRFRIIKRAHSMEAQMNSIIKLAEELNVDKEGLDEKLPILLEQLKSLSTSMWYIWMVYRVYLTIYSFSSRNQARTKKEKI